MIRKISTILVVLTLFVVTSAFARPGDPYRPYLSIGGGVSLLSDIDTTIEFSMNDIKISSDLGFNGFIAGGRAYDDGRVEFSLSYHGVDLDEVELNSTGATTDLTS